MIRHVLNASRPSRCEKTGKVLTVDRKRDPAEHPDCPAEGCDILIQNGYRYAWSESNVWYELVGPAGTRTKIVGPPR